MTDIIDEVYAADAGRQEIIYRYAAKKALQDIKAGVPLDDSLLYQLNAHPIINFCLAEIGEDDKEILKKIAAAKSENINLRQFALKMLRKLKDHQDVKALFSDLWKSGDVYEIKVEVLWILLSYSDLEYDLLTDIRSHFESSEWDKWLPLIVEKLGGNDKEKGQVKELLSSYLK